MKNKFYELGATFVKKWFWARPITELDHAVLAEREMQGFKDVLHVKIVDGTTRGEFLWNYVVLLIV